MSAERKDGGRRAGALGAAGAGVGAAFTATAASVCCAGPVVAPLVVAVLGASGAAWAAGLKPYSPYMLVVSGLLLAYVFRSLYHGRPDRCETGPSPGDALRRRWVGWAVVGVAWVSGALWLVAVGVNLVVFLTGSGK